MNQEFNGWISTELLSWNPQTNTFTGEASEIGINGVPKSLIVWNPKTMGSIFVNLDKKDYDTEGDIAGWRFKSHQGYNLLIIND